MFPTEFVIGRDAILSSVRTRAVAPGAAAGDSAAHVPSISNCRHRLPGVLREARARTREERAVSAARRRCIYARSEACPDDIRIRAPDAALSAKSRRPPVAISRKSAMVVARGTFFRSDALPRGVCPLHVPAGRNVDRHTEEILRAIDIDRRATQDRASLKQVYICVRPHGGQTYVGETELGSVGRRDRHSRRSERDRCRLDVHLYKFLCIPIEHLPADITEHSREVRGYAHIQHFRPSENTAGRLWRRSQTTVWSSLEANSGAPCSWGEQAPFHAHSQQQCERGREQAEH